MLHNVITESQQISRLESDCNAIAQAAKLARLDT
jgi:hypothetical protein